MFYCDSCNIILKRQGNHWWKHNSIEAKIVITKMSTSLKGRKVWNKNKTWEEIYGSEESKIRKEKHIENNWLPNMQSPQARKKVGDKLRGKKRPLEVGKKISLALTGVPLSESHKKSLSIHHWDTSGVNNPMYGKRGKDATNWMGGLSSFPYPFEFNKYLKEYIKKRDNYFCQNCFSKGDKLGRLYIHHINYDKINCSEYNLITTCSSCNSKANFKRDKWEKLYREKIDKIYNNPEIAPCFLY